MKVALDTNILTAIWVREPVAIALSEQLFQIKARHTLIVSPFTCVESRACPQASEASVAKFLSAVGISIDYKLADALWPLAADRFALFAERRRSTPQRETPRRIMADFLIGAHALLNADRLMTFDTAFYARNYPELKLHAVDVQ